MRVEYQLPKSATDFRIILLNLACVFSMTLGFLIFNPETPTLLIITAVISGVFVISIAGEIFISKSHLAKRLKRHKKTISREEYSDKIKHTMLGFCACLLFFVLYLLLIPEYSESIYILPQSVFLIGAFLSILIAGFIYFPYAINHYDQSDNYYLSLGYLIMGRPRKNTKQHMSQLLQGLILKGFFIIFMMSIALLAIENIFEAEKNEFGFRKSLVLTEE